MWAVFCIFEVKYVLMLDFITLLIGILFVVFLIGSFVLFLYLLIKFIKKSNFKAKQQKGKREIETSYKENTDIGMYFMDMYNAAGKRKNITYQHELETFYFLVGLASQGRIDEIEEIYEEEIEMVSENLVNYVFKGTNKEVIDEGGLENKWLLFLKEIKPKLLKMSKIAEKVDNMSMEDIKDGESIGEWQSRKLKKYRTFMNEFEYFKNYDIENTLKHIS